MFSSFFYLHFFFDLFPIFSLFPSFFHFFQISLSPSFSSYSFHSFLVIFLVSNWDCTLPHNIDSSTPLENFKISQHQPITNVSQIEKKLETMIVGKKKECKVVFYSSSLQHTTTNRRIFVRYTFSKMATMQLHTIITLQLASIPTHSIYNNTCKMTTQKLHTHWPSNFQSSTTKELSSTITLTLKIYLMKNCNNES